MDASSPLIVQGRTGHLLIPIVTIPCCAIGAALYYKDVLTDFCDQNAVKVIAAAVALDVLLLFWAMFLASRRMRILGQKLAFSSWFSDREIAIDEISDLTCQTDHSVDSASIDYVVLWGASGPLLRINPALWDRTALTALLRRLVELNAQIRVSREAYPYLSSSR
jgi:hypothetical protein